MNIISGFERATSGTITFYNKNFEQREPTVGYCPQENNMPALLTLSELFNLFYALRTETIVERERESQKSKLFGELGLRHHMHSKYGSLSIGMKRKFGLLVSIINEPDLILLDEPVSSLD